MGVEYRVPLSATLPPEGCFKPGSDLVRLKVVLERTFVVSVQGSGQSATSVTGTGGGALGATVTHSIETKLTNFQASGEVQLDMVDLARNVSTMDKEGFATTCLEAISVGLSRQFDLGRHVQTSVGTEAGFDRDLCFFAASLDVSFQHQVQLGSATVSASTTGSFKLRFGPGMRVYTSLAQRVGVPAVERFLMRVLPQVASESALLGIFRAAGIWGFAIQTGFDVMHLSQWICRMAWERGVRRGQAHKYASAYIYTVYNQTGYYRGQPDAIERTAINQAQRDLHHLGYALLRRRLEERFCGGRHILISRATGFAPSDSEFGPLIFAFGEALDRGAPP